MKKIFLSILILFLISTTYCSAETSERNLFKTKLNSNVNSAQAVADKANKLYGNSDSDGLMQNPFMNSPMNGYYNMMQGNSGNFSNNMQEMQRQQIDYTKQQMNKAPQEED